MTLRIDEKQRVTVWKVEDKQNYALVNFSSSRKDKKTDAYVNSGWGNYSRFVGEAYKKINLLEPKTRIVLKSAIIAKEPYMKDNVVTYPPNPTITVFNFEVFTPEEPSRMDEPPMVEDDPTEDTQEDEEELPF